MSIIRLIHIKIDPTEMENALQVWKTECAPLMIQQKGCISEKLLRCREAHELISYSEWDTEADIELYRNGDAHKEIVRHTRALKGSKAEVKLLRPRHIAAVIYSTMPICDGLGRSCPCRKLKLGCIGGAARPKSGVGSNATDALNFARDRQVLLQRQVRAGFIVICHRTIRTVPKVPFAKAQRHGGVPPA